MRIERMMLDIVERLQPLATDGVEVQVLPDVQAEFERPTANKGRLSVVFFEMKPSGPMKSAGRTVQEMDMTFHLMIHATKMEGPFGISDLHNRARKLLIGYDPTDCDDISHGGLMFSRYLTSLWEYNMILNTKTLLVEDYTESPDAPPVTQIEVVSDYGTSTIPAS